MMPESVLLTRPLFNTSLFSPRASSADALQNSASPPNGQVFFIQIFCSNLGLRLDKEKCFLS